MKKLIAIFLLISLSLTCFWGCSFIEELFDVNDPDIISPEEPEQNTEQDSTSTTDDEQAHVRDKSHLENLGKPVDPVVITEGEIDKNSDLVYTLRAYLFQTCWITALNPYELFIQINDVKNGIQPLHVAFDPNNYYFVAAYYNSPDGHHESYCSYGCSDNYTWVCYKNAPSIQEYYNGQKCFAAFQINLPLTITDIVSGDRATPNMQHYQPYYPTFESGFNTNEPLFFDDMFIYLNYSLCLELGYEFGIFHQSTNAFYYCSLTHHSLMCEIPCVCIEGDYYIPFSMYTLYNDGSESSPRDYTREFGEYYDALTGMMQYGKYSITNSYGVTVYSVISIEDFFDVLVE